MNINSIIQEEINKFLIRELDEPESGIYSESFKSWFGDWENDPKHSSFVVDAEGKPAICYHSTQAEFDRFDPKFIGSGGAGAYHGYGFNFTVLPNTTYGPNVKKVYLNAKKPLSSKKKTITLNKLMKIFFAVDKGEGDSIACEFTGDYTKINGPGYYANVLKAAKQLYDYAEGDLTIYSNISIASHCGPKKIIDIFSKLGFDSSAEYYDDGRLRVVTVFSTDQIRYVDNFGNITESNNKFEHWSDKELNELYPQRELLDDELKKWNKFFLEKYGFKRCFAAMHTDVVDPQDLEKMMECFDKYYKIDKRIKSLEVNRNRDLEAHENGLKYKEDEELFEKAIEEFGTTNNFGQAGYILPDGQMLNFGQYGVRGTDHRGIGSIYDTTFDCQSDYMIDFMKRGAIRLMCSQWESGIDLICEPTSEQYEVIKRLVRKSNDEFYVDFSNSSNGESLCYASYNNPNPNRIVADIYRYFNEGIKPSGDQ